MKSNKKFAGRLMGGAAALAMLVGAGQAFAQAPAADSSQVEEVVVTGTLIRGIAPIGANVQSVGTQDIQRIGAMSTNQILANIPAITSQFNTVAATPSSVFLNVFRPNIRNISSSGGNTTLVLVDGHNQVGVGTLQTTPDAGMIPAGALERVEVLADGGSALYGADAVGGIVNYITRNKFDGFEVSSRYGGAEGGYKAWDFNATGGRTWDTGGLILAFTARANTPLYSIDRERPRQNLTPFGGTDFRGRACTPGNITVAGVTYAMQNRVAGTLNLCDTTALGNIAPEEHLYSLFGGFTQKITDDLTFEVKGIYSDRLTKSRSAALTAANATINTTNPFFQPIGTETSQTVNFDFSPFIGLRGVARSNIKQYTVTPQLTYKLGDWQIKALYNKGHSLTDTTNPSLSRDFANYLAGPGLTTANAINPYNLLATNPQTLAQVTQSAKLIGYARQDLDDVRFQGDGPLFDLPGGTVRTAIGGEWQHSALDAFQGTPAATIDDPTIGRGKATRNVRSLFGQLNIPIIGSGNSFPLVQAFTIDLSGRYDNYSDFGTTTNPKIAFTWQVIDGLSFRGNWGTSFNAPSLADTSGGADARFQYFPTTGSIRPGDAATNLQRATITVSGGKPTLQPQTAHTYSYGFDFNPTFLKGFTASASYWSVDLKSRIGLATTGPTLFTIPAFSNYYIVNPTLQQVLAYGAALPLQGFPGPSVAALYAGGNAPYLLVDLRRDNFGTFRTKGVDFNLGYRQPLSFGAVYARISGTKYLQRKSQNGAGTPVTNELIVNNSKLALSSTVGIDIGAFSASATQNYSQGYDVTGVTNQTHIASFAPINLSFRYDIQGDSIYTKDLSLSLNVDNVLDKQPPFSNTTGGTANGSTLGRYVAVGVRKRF